MGRLLLDVIGADLDRDPSLCSAASLSFSSSRSSRCWRSPTCATSVLAANASSERPSRVACSRTQPASSQGLIVASATIWPLAALHRRVQCRRRLVLTFLAGEERDRRVGRHRGHRGHDVLGDLSLLEALGPVHHDHAPADRERHRREHERDGFGRARRRRREPRRCLRRRRIRPAPSDENDARRSRRGRRRGSGRRA